MAKEVTKEQIKKEKSLLKKLIPGWQWVLERRLRKKKWAAEPFPTGEKMLKEHKALVEAELKLKKLLKPVRKKPVKRSTKKKSSKPAKRTIKKSKKLRKKIKK